MTREQYEAAISQETQMFSVADAEAATGGYQDTTPPYGYDVPSGPARPRRPDTHNGHNTSAYPYAYGQPSANGYDSAHGANGYGGNDYGASEYGSNDYGASEHGSSDYGTNDYGTNDYGANDYGATGYGANGHGGPEDPGWGSGARTYHGRGDRSAYPANGYPGPYDPRRTDRR